MPRFYFLSGLVCSLLIMPVLLYGENEFLVKKATQQIELTGYTRSKTSRTLSCEVPGKILRVNYEIGERIGEKAFCKIDPTFINLDIKRTRQNIKQLEFNRQRINSRVLYLKKEFERIENLFKRQSISEVRMDESAKNLSVVIDTISSFNLVCTSILIS